MMVIILLFISITLNVDLLALRFLKITFDVESTNSDVYFSYICNFFLDIVISHLCLFGIIF